MTHLLKAEGLTLFRGETCLIRDLHFALDAGEALLLMGPNGSGKTSLLRALAGLMDVEDGEISWRGQSSRVAGQDFRADIGWFAHRTGFKGDLTIVENLLTEAGLRALDLAQLAPALARLGLDSRAELPFRALSAGQQRRAALARLVLCDATLWIMDEPLTNLDADGQSLVAELIQEHLARQGACLLASHQPLDAFPGLRHLELG